MHNIVKLVGVLAFALVVVLFSRDELVSWAARKPFMRRLFNLRDVKLGAKTKFLKIYKLIWLIINHTQLATSATKFILSTQVSVATADPNSQVKAIIPLQLTFQVCSLWGAWAAATSNTHQSSSSPSGSPDCRLGPTRWFLERRYRVSIVAQRFSHSRLIRFWPETCQLGSSTRAPCTL